MRLFWGLLLFVCACVPGCGQMKQGYMKRGISQTIAFCVILATAVFLEIGALAVFLVPLWVYSFFDTYNLRRQMLDGAAQEDTYLFGLSDMDSQRLKELLAKRHSLIGWVLVGAGLLVLWQNISRTFYNLFISIFGSESWRIYDGLTHGVPRMVVTLLIIALGIWFIRGPQKKPEDSAPDFTPPEEPFTAKGPYTPEAQVPIKLQLHPETAEDGRNEEAPHGDDC